MRTQSLLGAAVLAMVSANPASAGEPRSIAQIVLETQAASRTEARPGVRAAARPAVVVLPSGNVALVVTQQLSRLERSGRLRFASDRFAPERVGSTTAGAARLGRGYSRYNRVLGNNRVYSAGVRAALRSRGAAASRADGPGPSRASIKSSFGRGYADGLRARLASQRTRGARR